jgi:hypothetical protein
MILLTLFGLKIEATGPFCGKCRFLIRTGVSGRPECLLFRIGEEARRMDFIRNGDGSKHYEGTDPLPSVGRHLACIAATQETL